jgi:hypothetical protein
LISNLMTPQGMPTRWAGPDYKTVSGYNDRSVLVSRDTFSYDDGWAAYQYS